jgi:plasmid maintenance system antidote protein VapI
VACGVDAEVIRGILTAKRRVTRKIAERFADVLGMSPQFWLNYEKIYRDGLKAGKKECS